MKRCLVCLVFLVAVSVQAPAPAYEANAQARALGHVSFPTSCTFGSQLVGKDT